MLGRKHRTSFSSLVALGGLIAACAPETPLEPALLAQRVALYARSAGHSTATGTGFAGDKDSTLRTLADALDSARKDLESALPSPVPSPLLDLLGKNDFLRTLFDPRSPSTLEQKLHELSVGLERWVKERLLAAGNLEEKSDDAATYLLRPDPTCRPLAAPGVAPPPMDEACRRRLQKVEVRVLVKPLLDGISLRFVVGPDRLEASHVIVRLDGLEWRADLTQAAAAQDLVDDLLGLGKTRARRFGKLAGKTLLAIKKDAAAGVTVALSVLAPVEVARVDAEGRTDFTLKVAAAETPVLALSGDGAARTLLVQLSLGAVQVGVPWDPRREGKVNTDYVTSFDRLAARGRLVERSRELRLMGIQLAGYRERVRDVETLSVALSPNEGFDLTAVLDPATKMPRFEVSPRLEITGTFRMAGLAGDFGDRRPYLPDEVIRLVAEGGGGGGARLSFVGRDGIFAGVRVDAGALTISSSKSSAAVAPSAGRCLTRAVAPATDAHPLLRWLAVVDCPVKTTMGGDR